MNRHEAERDCRISYGRVWETLTDERREKAIAMHMENRRACELADALRVADERATETYCAACNEPVEGEPMRDAFGFPYCAEVGCFFPVDPKGDA